MFLPHPRVKVSIVGSLRDREVACSASDRQGSNFESCVWRTVSSQSSHRPQEVLLAQFSLYVHKSGLNPDSFGTLSISVMSSKLAADVSRAWTQRAPQQTRGVGWCWASVVDDEPTWDQHWANASCLLDNPPPLHSRIPGINPEHFNWVYY